MTIEKELEYSKKLKKIGIEQFSDKYLYMNCDFKYEIVTRAELLECLEPFNEGEEYEFLINYDGGEIFYSLFNSDELDKIIPIKIETERLKIETERHYYCLIIEWESVESCRLNYNFYSEWGDILRVLPEMIYGESQKECKYKAVIELNERGLL